MQSDCWDIVYVQFRGLWFLRIVAENLLPNLVELLCLRYETREFQREFSWVVVCETISWGLMSTSSFMGAFCTMIAFPKGVRTRWLSLRIMLFWNFGRHFFDLFCMVCVDGASINRALSKHASEATCCREFVQGTRMSYLNACYLNVIYLHCLLRRVLGCAMCRDFGRRSCNVFCPAMCLMLDEDPDDRWSSFNQASLHRAMYCGHKCVQCCNGFGCLGTYLST